MRALRGGSEVFLNFEFCFFLAEAAGSAAAVSPSSRGCEEALLQRSVRRGLSALLNFDFSFSLAEAFGCKEALISP